MLNYELFEKNDLIAAAREIISRGHKNISLDDIQQKIIIYIRDYCYNNTVVTNHNSKVTNLINNIEHTP
jgi:hypothetical protein